jgi:four helix bundle protein
MRRASASIGANIAEGCGQHSQRELGRFLQVAIASASETQHHLMFAHQIGLLAAHDHARLTRELGELRRMLSALQGRVRESLKTENQLPTTNDSQLH